MRRILFTWNYPQSEAGKLRYLCLRQNVTWREVLPEEDARPLRSLSVDAPSHTGGSDAHRFSEPVMLFAGFTMQDMDDFATAYINSSLPRIPLKAMMTPTNRHWTIEQLYGELRKEHQSLTGESLGDEE